MKGIHPHDIATILDDDGVAIRAGHHCCQILHEKLEFRLLLEPSIGLYNNKKRILIYCVMQLTNVKVFEG